MWINAPVGRRRGRARARCCCRSPAPANARASFDAARRRSRVTAGLTVLAYALLEDLTLVPVAAVLIAAFVVIERRTEQPARPARRSSRSAT